jgi:hypothetical protein
MRLTYRDRIARAIADCDRYIKLESPRAADLRPAQTQQLLDFYLEHRAKLQAMLEAA